MRGVPPAGDGRRNGQHNQLRDGGLSVTDTESIAAQITRILERGNDVRDWPADEQELHRNGHSEGSEFWNSFDERHNAVVAFRAQKVIVLLADQQRTAQEAAWNEAAGCLTDLVVAAVIRGLNPYSVITDMAPQGAPASDSTGAMKLKIFLNTNITMSRGKYAAHAVHAALTAFGVHPGTPVVVLGAKPRDIENMRVSIRDEGRTELQPGTLTAGTDWPNTHPAK
jgi:PTH2 family peptidyl-tRNA hydrolase